jgi:hypothetical protein
VTAVGAGGAELEPESFATLLVEHGLPPGVLSRQCISQVEGGSADLPAELWSAVRAALRAAGYGDAETALLVTPRRTVITPLRESTPPVRRDRWQRLLKNVPGNRWWLPPTGIAAQVLGSEWIENYRILARKYGIDVERDRREVLRRLAIGGQWVQDADDRVSVHPDDIDQIEALLDLASCIVCLRRLKTSFCNDQLLP